MSAVAAALRLHREAADAVLTTARDVSAERWVRPRAPGQWSPGQVVEHLALAYETSREVLLGRPIGRAAPRWLRPVIRWVGFRPVLRRGRFFRGSPSPPMFRPGPVPAPPAAGVDRLARALTAFEDAAAALPGDSIDHPFFGRLPVAEFVRLQELHARHHRTQLLPGG